MSRPDALALSLLALAACAVAPPAAPPRAPAAPAPQPAADRTLRYSFVMMDHPQGGSVVTVHAGGARDATWEFNDRGRGPKQQTHYEVGADGMLSRVDTTGVDYFKQAIQEHVARDAATLSWKNDAEQGSVPASTRAFYVPAQGAPDLFGALVRALIAVPEHELPLLPAGRAKLTRGDELNVGTGGRSMHVIRYAIEGLDFRPDHVWLDDDGEIFLHGDGWAAVVREGWEATVPQLLAAQVETEARRLASLAGALGHRTPEAGLALVHARLFDVESKTVVPDATIVIRGDRIAAAGPGARIRIPAGAEVLDAAGKTAIPGLWDMHAHVSPGDGLLDLAAGVLGARDLGNDEEPTFRTRRAWDSGTEIGPRLVLAGFIDGRGPFQAPTKVFADTKEEGFADIDHYASRGYEQIKLYSSLKTELVAPLAAYAHGKGLRVSGHVPTGMTAEEAVVAGYDELQHANFLFLNFLATKGDDTRTPLRFTRVAEKAAGLDLASAPVQAFARLLAAHKIVIDPTLGAFEGMFTARRGQVDPSLAPIADRLPAQVRRGALQGGLPVPEGMDATYRASFGAMQKLVKVLWDHGVRVVAGTDSLAGFGLHRELELYEQAGIPAADVLTIATLGAARVMHHDRDWGSISPGKYADVVLVDGQPDVHVKDVRRPALVIKGGVVYRSAELYAALGVRP